MSGEETPVMPVNPENRNRETRVLLIEDSRADADYVKRSLAKCDRVQYTIFHRDRLEDGLDLLARETFDVILLDMNLPDSTGEETYQTALKKAAKIPIIMMTGMEDELLAEDAIRSGAQDYLSKR